MTSSIVPAFSCDPPPSPLVCDYVCSIPSLAPTPLNTSQYDAACTTGSLTWNILAEPLSVVRIRVLPDSTLKSGERLIFLEHMVPLLEAKSGEEDWTTSDSSNVTVRFTRASAPSAARIVVTAYNQSSQNETIADLEGVITLPEQTNATGHPDYAVNSEMLWMLDLNAYHINFTVRNLDLEPAAGDLLIIGYGRGPWADEPSGSLLTGTFKAMRLHLVGGQAFIYLLSRKHAKPRAPFAISYVAEEIKGSTTTPMTTTDKNHPPTPDDLSFELDIFITGTDRHLFLNTSTNATARLRHQLAYYTDVYRQQHGIDVWRAVHDDDIQFSSWRLCRYTSGWVLEDDDCFMVSWYVEMLTKHGDWAFNTTSLRSVISTFHGDISNKLGYTVSLTLEEVNKVWFWGITIAIVPLGLVIFGLLFFNRSKAYRNEIDPDDIADDLDERCAADAVFDESESNHIRKLVPPDIIEEKDRQLRNVFNTDEYEDYDAELHSRHRRKALQARFSKQAPLKSALKSPKPTPAPVLPQDNAAFEPEDQTNTTGQTFFPPAFDVTAASQHAKVREEADLELLPRVKNLVHPEDPASPTVLYNMHDDGTGTVVDQPKPGQQILQLDATRPSGPVQQPSSTGAGAEDPHLEDTGVKTSGKETPLMLRVRRIASDGSAEEEC